MSEISQLGTPTLTAFQTEKCESMVTQAMPNAYVACGDTKASSQLLKVALVQITLQCLTQESALTPNPFLKCCDVTALLEIHLVMSS